MLSSHNYLYVEDDPLSRQVMEMIMTHAIRAESLTVFEDSTNLLERVAAMSVYPDVVLLDIHVEPYDGFAMLRMLRAVPELVDTRIVALTASVMNEEIEQLKSAGFDGAIAKPLSVSTFPNLLRSVCAGEVVWHVA